MFRADDTIMTDKKLSFPAGYKPIIRYTNTEESTLSANDVWTFDAVLACRENMIDCMV